MLSPEHILRGLSAVTNSWRGLALAWHVYFGALALALALGARPTVRLTALLLGLPLLSVSTLAWRVHNPFNGTVFTALAALSAIIPARRSEQVQYSLSWTLPGAMLLAFGWLYPHFLATLSAVPYLYASPLGLIPCPTLAAVTGIGLMTAGLGSRGWMLVISAADVFYGVFGAVVLAVSLDWVLVGGAVILFVYALFVDRRMP